MAPSQDGERAERLINTLFGAKHGGQHRQERALALTSLRCTRRRCALATLSYDNMVPRPKFAGRKRTDADRTKQEDGRLLRHILGFSDSEKLKP